MHNVLQCHNYCCQNSNRRNGIMIGMSISARNSLNCEVPSSNPGNGVQSNNIGLCEFETTMPCLYGWFLGCCHNLPSTVDGIGHNFHVLLSGLSFLMLELVINHLYWKKTDDFVFFSFTTFYTLHLKVTLFHLSTECLLYEHMMTWYKTTPFTWNICGDG